MPECDPRLWCEEVEVAVLAVTTQDEADRASAILDERAQEAVWTTYAGRRVRGATVRWDTSEGVVRLAYLLGEAASD